MQLREWQQQFQQVVLGTTSVDTLPLQLKNLSRELSMGIYANAYRERLHEALRTNFGALHQLLGGEDFAAMAYAFIATYPPQTSSIRWFGDTLSLFLRRAEPYRSCPALSELAQFEWAVRHTVDAADAERIDANFLLGLTAGQWETLRCKIHPSLSILQFAWNAPQVWRALDSGEEPPAPAKFDSYWLVYRGADLISRWRSADANEAASIQFWANGENFGALCELLVKKIGDAESAVATAASFMRTWAEQGLLVYTHNAIHNQE